MLKRAVEAPAKGQATDRSPGPPQGPQLLNAFVELQHADRLSAEVVC